MNPLSWLILAYSCTVAAAILFAVALRMLMCDGLQCILAQYNTVLECIGL